MMRHIKSRKQNSSGSYWYKSANGNRDRSIGFLRERANSSSESLKQGVWGCGSPEAIGYWVLEVPKSKVYGTFDEFLKDADKVHF